ncbi:MAG: rod shape-determining protein MreC [Clostridia bacterium]|nr:rod shape-determining protein MreC [Clostridia bacterium]
MPFYKKKQFKAIVVISVLLIVGMMISAISGSSFSPESTVVGTLFYPAQKLASSISSKIVAMRDNVSGKSSYEEELDALKLEVAELQEQLVDYENVKRENDYYKDFLEVKEENPDFKLVHGSIVARDSESLYSSFTIGVGSAQGIQVNDCIIYGKYLVGLVVRVYPTSAVVKTVLDPDIAVSCYEARTGESSYTSNDLTLAKQGKLMMANLSKKTNISTGGIVCSSGVGGIYPKDLIIGKVENTQESGKDVSYIAVVNPQVKINELTDVFVITDFEGKNQVAN